MADARDELDHLREAADLRALAVALVQRGEAALERGDWPRAQRDLDEAAQVAAMLADGPLQERARRGAALAYRADGRIAAARLRS
jgi:hypothetical protein